MKSFLRIDDEGSKNQKPQLSICFVRQLTLKRILQLTTVYVQQLTANSLVAAKQGLLLILLGFYLIKLIAGQSKYPHNFPYQNAFQWLLIYLIRNPFGPSNSLAKQIQVIPKIGTKTHILEQNYAVTNTFRKQLLNSGNPPKKPNFTQNIPKIPKWVSQFFDMQSSSILG